jgi:hypothetical protein
MLNMINIGRRIALLLVITTSIALASSGPASSAALTAGAANASGNFFAAGGKDALLSLFNRIGVNLNLIDLSNDPSPFDVRAEDIFATYSQIAQAPSLDGIKGLIIAEGDVLSIGWRLGDSHYFRSLRYEGGRWVSFVQSTGLANGNARKTGVHAATNASETLNITFAPPSVVSTTTGQKGFTVTQSNGRTYFNIPLSSKIAALSVQGSINGVVQVTGIGTSVLIAMAAPNSTSPRGTVPVLVVYSDSACP